MKKALLVLGFAMCTTLAFAQTNKINASVDKCKSQTISAPEMKPADYKASIFTKDETMIQQWDFAAANMTGILYGSNGLIQAGDMIDGAAATPHGQDNAAQMWQRVADSATLYSSDTWAQVGAGWKSAIARYMASAYTGNNNGYMLVVPNDVSGTGMHNCYIQFPSVDVSTATVIDIRFIQSYYNYYDECYIDYQVNGQWKSRAINVDGVDCEINSWGPVRASYPMPLDAAGQSSLNFRIRFSADGGAGSAYGYFWALDNVTVVAAEANRMATNHQKFLDGFYGTMPQNMSIPLAWYGEAINTGSNTRSNIQVNFSHIDNTLQNSTNILSEQYADMPANPTEINYMIVDERGFVQGEQDNRPNSGVFEAGNIGGSHIGWWYYGPNYGATNINPNLYGLAGLPVTDLGQQFFAASVSSTGADDVAWDTVAYQVVGETGGDGNLALQGYRWAHDNGIIPSASCYRFGYTQNTQFVTDSCPRWTSAHYMVMNRFTTGNTIPNNWVFRGLEIVPQTESALGDIADNRIIPVMYEVVWNDDSSDWDFVEVATGSYSSNNPYIVQWSDLNNLPTGRLAPSDPYHAVNMQFYNQPVLKPNTSYYMGYQLVEDGKFGAAMMQYSYLGANGQTYVPYYRDDNPEVANGYYQFVPNSNDMYIYDPGKGGYFAGWNTDYCAHIRPIVGPRMSLTEYHINANCGEGVEMTDEQFEEICDGYAISYAGATPTVYIFPEGEFNPAFWASTDTATGAYKIDLTSLTIDGQPVDIDDSYNDFSIAEGNYTVYDADSSHIMLRRTYIAITFNNIDDHHTVGASAIFTLFNPENTDGIDPAALNVSLGLQPNPATSSVKLNISGVAGMVNCSIIDMSGRVVYNANINAEQQQVIDLSNVAAGAYFVRVTNDKFSKVEKLIVR